MTKKQKKSLTDTHPEIAKEADGWDPSTTVFGRSEKVSWRCPKGHTYVAVIADRTRKLRPRGCPYCAGRRVLCGFNDLATTHPELASQAVGWDPQTISAGSHQVLRWKCSVGHFTETTVKNRALLGNGCRICANQEVLPGFNDLATKFPEVAKSANGWDPRLVLPGSNKKYQWMCPLGHLYEQSVGQRVNGHGCSFCAGKRILIGFNDLKTTYPNVAAEAHGWDPTKVIAGSHKKFEFKCRYNHIFTSTVKDRTVKGSGCPDCSTTGFSPDKEAYLYFLVHEEKLLYQVGITNFPQDRLKVHRARGWELVDLRGPSDGYLVCQWEIAILRHIKLNGGKMANKMGIEPFDGYSESWLKESFTFVSLKEIMDVIDQDDRKP